MSDHRYWHQPRLLRDNILRPATNIITLLFLVVLLSDTLQPLDDSFLRLISVLLLLGIVLLNLPLGIIYTLLFKEKNRHRPTIATGVLLLFFSFAILLVSPIPFLWIASIPLLIASLDLLLQKIGRRHPELPLLAITSFSYAILFLLLQTVPALWSLFQQFSLHVSQTISMVLHTPLLLGPTFSGLWIFLIFLLFALTTVHQRPQKTRKYALVVLGWIFGLFLSWIIATLILGALPFESNQDTLTFLLLPFLFCLIPTALYFIKNTIHTSTKNPPPSRTTPAQKLYKNGAVWAVVLLISASILLTFFFNTQSPPGETKKIVFYTDHMLGTWDVPAYGKYGRDATGMFGLLPPYLTLAGYQTELIVKNTTEFLNASQPLTENITRSLNLTDYVSLVESREVTRTLLADARIFVVTNLNISFSAKEHDVIWEFVKNGGSLLVLGDHTNVGDMQTPLNELLSPVGIRFRFDAALPLDQKFKWTTCAQMFYTPASVGLPSLDTLQISVGASLDIAPTALPLIIGTYAFSDEGNRSSPEMAYLGDYAYHQGEQLGDIILAAGAYYGDGKVLVFGDTSSFQNSALPASTPFLTRIFRWLDSPITGIQQVIITSAALLLVLGAILASLILRNTRVSFTIVPLAICITLLLTTTIQPFLLPTPRLTGPIVTLDASHNERCSWDPFTDASLTGMILTLQRNNYLPIIERTFSTDTLTKSTLIIFNAPTKTFTADEVTVLLHYMEHGGFIILATGYEDKTASLPLLTPFTLDIDSTPLGPIPYIEGNVTAYQNEPRFVDSWPIIFDATQNATSYYNFTWNDYTYHLVIFMRYGDGGILLISDSQFLLDKNIESIYDYWPGNIIFLKHLLTELPLKEEHP